MKRVLVLMSAMLFLAFSVNAQWYYNSYNVSNINDLNKAQLDLSLTKANQSVKTGQIMTGIGVGVGIIGGIIYASGLSGIVNSNTIGGINDNLNKGIAGAYLMYGGIITAGIGIPIWIVGANKRNDIEVALVKFKGSASANGIGIKLRF
jgi:hypothetical protein